jgi:DNA topoisomerase VI subunit A
LGVVDADPYGLDILSVYKYGSKSMQHENDKLAATRIKWLGLWASEVERYDPLYPVLGFTDTFPIASESRKMAYFQLQNMMKKRYLMNSASIRGDSNLDYRL